MLKKFFLLDNCIIFNRKLKNDLNNILKNYGISLVPLISDKLKVDINLPIKLFGSLNRLIVVDASGLSFSLKLYTDTVVLQKFNVFHESSYLFNEKDFSIKQIDTILENGTSFCINLSESMIKLTGTLGDCLFIIFDEDITYDVTMFDLCIDMLNTYAYKTLRFDSTKIEDYLTNSKNSAYAIITRKTESTS